MKIQSKMPETNDRLHITLMDSGWVPLKEPKNLVTAIFLSIPLMFISTLLSLGIINLFSSLSLEEYGITDDSLSFTIHLGILLWIVLLLMFHEILHLVFVPNFLKSNKTFVGLTYFGGYVLSEEEISKARYLVITLAPYVMISIVLPILLSMIDLLTPTLKFLIVLNAAASSVDLLNVYLITKQVPNKSMIRNNGTKTYWRN
ncbi:DUF3267 domain-containing protein [Pontibacillus marinus]|uniref:DUF3267 domain-containing protein n=1 Tax=Pontibacillus marinus BH030004 = DSM 16465 TaxID=1385511 RepID=A0A0A5G0R1_9BACI|nr:DUF3267 domain-containing protein [Pontibacillus marinus]KGX85624.1 hypothetical protein N783_14110 [Pontibacillus marinus BH030004 = DSM 16465]